MTKLYAAQQAGVDRFLALPKPRRFILPWRTGCGKTAAALSVLKELGGPKTLIICPAVVRNHWHREIAKWVSVRGQEHSEEITVGRNRKLKSKKAIAHRERAYAAMFQIVSYDLLRDVDPTGWKYIVLDELHHIAQPRAKQSKLVAALVQANPDADILGLSATLIPTEVKQLWNPLRILFGHKEWGAPSKTGEANWKFLFKYCHIERSEYGCIARGLNASTAPELRKRLEPITYPLSREDISKDLPPLDLKLIQPPRKKGNKEEELREQIIDWAEQFDLDDVTHKVILVRHRALAKMIVDALHSKHGPQYIDGTFNPTWRSNLLADCSALSRCTLVATHECLSEGVRLMWAQQVIIAEWSQSPGRMMQLLGRFNSVGHTTRPQVNILCSGETYGAARQLLDRAKDVSALIPATASELDVQKTFDEAAKADTVDPSDWGALFDSQRPDDWSEDASE